jgi:pyruvate, water dikinase
LNAPSKRPQTSDSEKKYTQQKVDCIDLEAREFATKQYSEIALASDDHLLFDLYASRDREMEKRAAQLGRKDIFSWSLTFERLLNQTGFAKEMREMLKIIQDVYGSPVDVEFTVNFLNENEFKINVLQCRPLEQKGGGSLTSPYDMKDLKDIIIDASGPVIGRGRHIEIDRLIYIAPEQFTKLKISDRYELARVIGRLSHIENETEKTIMLVGPGRWGTSTPSLGVPVSYPEINTISVLVEIAILNKDMSSDISLGTHFFNDLIESETLYLGLLPYRKDNILRADFFMNLPNTLLDIYPEGQNWADVIKVIDPQKSKLGKTLNLYANAIEQKFILYSK